MKEARRLNLLKRLIEALRSPGKGICAMLQQGFGERSRVTGALARIFHAPDALSPKKGEKYE